VKIHQLKILTQPLDMDPTMNALLDAYGDGRWFTQHDISMQFNMPAHRVKALFDDLRHTLPACPEGPQLETHKSRGSRFIMDPSE